MPSVRALVATLLLLLSALVTAKDNNTESDARIMRGQYLAHAGNCISCHTRAGGAAFTGGLPFATPLGTIHSTNITPDSETGIGDWSVTDLQRAMRQGIAADGSHLFPVFPYTAYTRVSDADVADLYAYLRTLTPVRYVPPDNDILLRLRWPLAIWKALFFTPGRHKDDAAQSREWNRGAYLVEGLGHCSVCHTPRNAWLAERPERAYQGAVMQGEVSPGKERAWFAVNLTSARHGLGAWSVAELSRYLHTGFSPRAGTFGPMNEVIVNGLMHLQVADVRAMAVYIKSLQGPAYTGATATPELMKTGAPLYKDHCEKCHGRSGRGGFFSGPPLAGSAVVQGEDPASLINSIIHGPLTPEQVSFGAWETMPAYADELDDAQIAAVCNFVRGSWGNRASAVSAEQVKRQR